MTNAIGSNFLSLTGSTRVGAIGFTPQQYTGGVVDTSSMPDVNLENKTGTSNQVAILPGGRTTYTARSLDFSA